MSSKASSGAALGLADVDRQARLVAGAVEVDRIGGVAAAADRQVEAGEAVVELARQPGGGARRAASSSSAGTITAISAASSPPGLASDPGASERSARRARVSTRARHSPVWAARGAACRISTPAPALEVGAELGGAGDDVAAVGHLARQHRGDEGPGDLLALPLRRARALQLQRQQRRHHAGDRRLGGRGAAVAQLADRRCRRPAARPGSPPRRRRAASSPGRGRRRRPPARRWSGRSGRRWRRAPSPRPAPPRAARRPTRPPRRARRGSRPPAVLAGVFLPLEAAGIGAIIARTLRYAGWLGYLPWSRSRMSL